MQYRRLANPEGGDENDHDDDDGHDGGDGPGGSDLGAAAPRTPRSHGPSVGGAPAGGVGRGVVVVVEEVVEEVVVGQAQVQVHQVLLLACL